MRRAEGLGGSSSCVLAGPGAQDWGLVFRARVLGLVGPGAQGLGLRVWGLGFGRAWCARFRGGGRGFRGIGLTF